LNGVRDPDDIILDAHLVPRFQNLEQKCFNYQPWSGA
jgi:hypothetical protein